jgi:hypothetical protein
MVTLSQRLVLSTHPITWMSATASWTCLRMKWHRCQQLSLRELCSVDCERPSPAHFFQIGLGCSGIVYFAICAPDFWFLTDTTCNHGSIVAVY